MQRTSKAMANSFSISLPTFARRNALCERFEGPHSAMPDMAETRCRHDAWVNGEIERALRSIKVLILYACRVRGSMVVFKETQRLLNLRRIMKQRRNFLKMASAVALPTTGALLSPHVLLAHDGPDDAILGSW